MKSYFIAIFMLVGQSLFAQNYFSITHDVFDDIFDSSFEVIPIDEGIITLNRHSNCPDTQNRCCSYILYDYDGNIVVKHLIPEFFSRFDAMKYDEMTQEVVISGTEHSDTHRWHLYKCNLAGETTFHQVYEIPETEQYGAWNNALQLYNNHYVLIGGGMHGPDFLDGKVELMWIDEDGTLDTTMHLQNLRLYAKKGVVDNDNLLTIMYFANDTILSGRKRKGFVKFNEAKEIVWEWETEKLDLDDHRPMFDITANNEIVFVTTVTPDDAYGEPAVTKIDENGIEQWKYDFENSVFETQYVYDISVAANGDIIGTGLFGDYTEEDPDPELYDTGFAFRLSADGELLWQRIFRNIGADGELLYCKLEDIKELPNGDLIMVGRQYRELFDGNSGDAWLIITDENGCLNDDCEELIILDDKEQIYSENELRIIQNPVASAITLEANLPQVENLEYYLLDVTGKGVLSGKKAGQQQGTFNIEVENLATGMYYLYVAGEKKAITFKLVKN